MLNIIKNITCIMIISIFYANQVQAKTYTLVIGPAPGFIEEAGGTLQGNLFINEFVMRLEKKGLKMKVTHEPWKRADAAINSKKYDIEFPALLGDKALKDVVFSSPVTAVGMVIFSAEKPVANSIAELKGQVGITRGFSYPDELQQNNNIELQTANTVLNSLKKLSLGRLDYVIHWKSPTMIEIAREDIKNIKYGKIFNVSYACFAIAHTEHSQLLNTEINKTIAAMILDDSYTSLLKGAARTLLMSPK